MSTITKERIFAAADQLLEEGKNPTLANVRSVLGGGSFTTISEAMQEWKSDRLAPTAPIREVAPQPVFDRVQALANDIWSAALEIANSRLKSDREALEAAREEMEQEKAEAAEIGDQMSAEIERLKNQLEVATTNLNEIKEFANEVQQVNQDLKVERSADKASLDQLEKTVVSMQEQITLLQVQLIDEREKYQSQLKDERDKVETLVGQVAQLETENTGLLDMMEDKEKRADRDTKRAESRAEKMEVERDKVRVELASMMKEHGSVVGELDALRKQVAEQTALIKSLTSSEAGKRPSRSKKEDGSN